MIELANAFRCASCVCKVTRPRPHLLGVTFYRYDWRHKPCRRCPIVMEYKGSKLFRRQMKKIWQVKNGTVIASDFSAKDFSATAREMLNGMVKGG